MDLLLMSFNLDFEISLKLAKYKFKYDEIPIRYFPRKYKDGKKINFIDGINSLFIIFYFFFRN